MDFHLLWMLFGMFCTAVAVDREQPWVRWFLLGLVFGPFGFVLTLLACPQRRCLFCRRSTSQEQVTCPHCQITDSTG